MSIYGAFVAEEEKRNDLSAQLAFLYLEKSDTSGLSPSAFADKYFEVKQEISKVVLSHGSL